MNSNYYYYILTAIQNIRAEFRATVNLNKEELIKNNNHSPLQIYLSDRHRM
jgi:hypothetical protein